MELHGPRSNACWDSTYCTGFITYPSPSTCLDMQEVSGHYKNSIACVHVRDDFTPKAISTWCRQLHHRLKSIQV